MSREDVQIIESKIEKLRDKLKKLEVKLEDTTSGDIANTQMNLFANCSKQEDCMCGKCQIMRKERLRESNAFSPFANIFGA